ncbi:hypothetical protein KKA14_09110, partial [bacterium]|nr:hypothetical protein [bacterium]
MYKKRLSFMTMIMIFSLTLFMTSCEKETRSSTNKTLKLGCLAYSEPIIQWVKEGLAPHGYTVEVVMFDANQLPATALNDGNLDGIFANHRPWILTFNKMNNADLEMVKPYYFHSFFAIYSKKYK